MPNVLSFLVPRLIESYHAIISRSFITNTAVQKPIGADAITCSSRLCSAKLFASRNVASTIAEHTANKVITGSISSAAMYDWLIYICRPLQ